LQSKCKECCNEKNNYSFDNEYVNIHSIPWYIGKEDEIRHKYRYMEYKELAEYFHVESNDIKNVIRNLKLNGLNKNRDDYTEDEVIYLYDMYINGKRDAFPDGFAKVYRYKIILLRYLIQSILDLKNKKDICRNFKFDYISQYKMNIVRQNIEDTFQVLCDSFPEYKFKRWELRDSGMPQGFWQDENNFVEVVDWFLMRLKEDKMVCNIYDAKKLGFGNLLKEYNLYGCFQSVNKSEKQFFEFVFNEKMIDYNSIENSNIELKMNGILYLIKDNYYNLDDKGKYLINEIIRYCEIEKEFPCLSNLTNLRGYVTYNELRKYFKKLIFVYNYIRPIKYYPMHYWEYKENRIYEIKYYCEKLCEVNIMDVIDDRIKLYEWINKYYTSNVKSINNIIYSMGKSKWFSFYDRLCEAYPQIKENNILFNWELVNYNPKDKKDIYQMLRELVFYRMNDVIINPITDIPKYINTSYVGKIYPKFNVYITKKKFKNYYEWCSNAFPEYKNNWNEQEFGIIASRDNYIFGSYEEKEVYEYIKFNMDLQFIKYIGNSRKGKYCFELENLKEYKYFCPDFAIEYILYKDKKIKLLKPIIVEYYGFWRNKKLEGDTTTCQIVNNYIDKTIEKNKYYKSKDDIYFIDLYPEDLKNNMQGVREKLTSFFMLNFNIDIEKNLCSKTELLKE
jgi:hypothetical protein